MALFLPRTRSTQTRWAAEHVSEYDPRGTTGEDVLRTLHRVPPRRLGASALVVVSAILLVSPAGARAAISVRVRPTKDAVVFRFEGIRPCDSVVADANVIQWLGPEVSVVVERGTKTVASARWLACTYRKGRFWPWARRPKTSNGTWLPAGRENVLTLKADMPASAPSLYRFDVSVNGRRVRSGRIRVSTASGTRRIVIA